MKYLFAIFTLLVALGMVALSVVFVFSAHNAAAAIPTMMIALGTGVFIAKDWVNVWKPLFAKK